MNALAIEGLQLHRKEGFSLGPISLAVPRGSRTAIVGRSGAGKSTLLRCIAGLETPDAGTIRIGDRVAFDGRERLAPHERRIGFVFQGGGLWPHLDALSHLRYAAPRLSVEAAQERLARVGLAGKERRKPSELSGGEAQRLALARALAVEPSILLLDEPLRSLDVHLRIELCLLIRDAVREAGTTLLAVTHDREEARMLAGSAVVIDGGRSVEEGAIEAIAESPSSAHGAALLANAACLAVEGDGVFATPFGAFPRPAGLAGEVALVLLPGDAEIAAEGAAATVLFSEAASAGAAVHVELRGPTVARDFAARVVVLHPHPLAPGSAVRLRLARAPRFLPYRKGPLA